jgi:hypothetical protein
MKLPSWLTVVLPPFTASKEKQKQRDHVILNNERKWFIASGKKVPAMRMSRTMKRLNDDAATEQLHR